MTTENKYVPFALVALVAGVLGWGASTWSNREMTAAQSLPANNSAALGNALSLQPNTQPALQPLPQPAVQLAGAPMTYVAVPAQPAQVVAVREAAAPVVRTAPVRTRAVVAANETAATPAGAPTVARKKGMSNKTKTVLAIGGGAGLGAAIGGIAKGGKGAAIGAIVGAGSGALYSVIRHKQNKPVF